MNWVPAIPAKAAWDFGYTYLPNAVIVAETGSTKATQAGWTLYL